MLGILAALLILLVLVLVLVRVLVLVLACGAVAERRLVLAALPFLLSHVDRDSENIRSNAFIRRLMASWQRPALP